MIYPSIYKNRAKSRYSHLGDGILNGSKEDFCTFYKYTPPNELIFLFHLSGFQQLKSFKVDTNHAHFFKKSYPNLLELFVDENLVLKNIKSKMKIENNSIIPVNNTLEIIDPYPEAFNLLNITLKLFTLIQPGIEDNNKFKYIVAGLFQFIFSDQLSNMKIEDPINEGMGKVDITFQNKGEKGLFYKINNVYQKFCPIILIEVKNNNIDLRNEQISQLWDRFDDNRGRFGFLICRDKGDPRLAIRHSHIRIDNGYGIILDDKDLILMLRIYFENGMENVNNFIDKKIKEIIM